MPTDYLLLLLLLLFRRIIVFCFVFYLFVSFVYFCLFVVDVCLFVFLFFYFYLVFVLFSCLVSIYTISALSGTRLEGSSQLAKIKNKYRFFFFFLKNEELRLPGIGFSIISVFRKSLSSFPKSVSDCIWIRT